MKKFLYIFFLSVFALSCNNEIEKPKDLIPENQMKQILKEVYVYRQVKNFYVKKGLPKNAEINLKILEKYGVSLEQFQSSYKYYLIDNAAYDEILQEIKEELEAELPNDTIKKLDKPNKNDQKQTLKSPKKEDDNKKLSSPQK